VILEVTMNVEAFSAESPAGDTSRPALVFRSTVRFSDAPGAGDLILVAARQNEQQRRDRARLFLERGAAGFVAGSGPIRQIVLPPHPTFDDLLAAEFLARSLAGETLPAGCGAWAEYAKLVREGLRPGDVPLERSVEAVFLAMVNDPELIRPDPNCPDPDLTLPANEELFLRNWAKLARRVMQAAEQGLDPFTTPLCDGAEFARERTFLARDRDVYRQDVTRGERWIVSVPDGPPKASALVLRQPKCVLFKHWPRIDESSPTGDGYLLLAVRWAASDWAFSTDPVHRLSLTGLAEMLQTAESEADPQSAAANPWFDGAPLNHTLIAAPEGGSKLEDERIEEIVKQWCGADDLTATPDVHRESVLSRRTVLTSSLATGAAAVSAITWWNWPRERPREELVIHSPRVPAPQETTEPIGNWKPKLYLLTIGVSDYPRGRLPCAVKDAKELAAVFKKQEGRVFHKVTTRVLDDANATKGKILDGLKWLQMECTRHDLAMITFSGHGISDPNTDFVFLPHAYDETSEPATTGLTIADLSGYLRNMACHRIVIMDTCHSGRAIQASHDGDLRQRGADPLEGSELDSRLERQIAAMHDKMKNLPQTTVFFAACLGSETAVERDSWGHGALTLAILEAIQGELLYAIGQEADMPVKPGWKSTITLQDLDYYATHRVKDLTGQKQSVLVRSFGELPLHGLPIAIVEQKTATDE
jgi:uncharacterized caspase-like protein